MKNTIFKHSWVIIFSIFCVLCIFLTALKIRSNVSTSTLALENDVYYISAADGNDSYNGLYPSYQGGSNGPWHTIQKAADIAVGGDIVYIRGGTYPQRVQLKYKNNAAGPDIIFSSYPNEDVILDGTGIDIQYGEGLFHIWKTDHVRVSGLKIQHSNGAGIYVAYANNIIVEKNTTHDTVKSGIGIWGSSNVVVDGNDVSLACNPHPNYNQSEENITIDASSNVVVKYNVVHDGPTGLNQARAGGEGINVKNGSSDITINNNLVYNLDKLAFGVDAWNSTNPTANVNFYNNTAHNTYYGFIVSSEQGASVDGVKIYNNIAYNITRAGFSIPWWSGTLDGIKRNVWFVNNTSINNGYGFWNQSPSNENVIVRNNIFSQNGTNVSIVSGAIPQTTVDHNLFFGSGGVYGSNQIVGDPLFVNVGSNNFKLTSNSPAIDTGSSLNSPVDDFDGTSRPQGSGFDLGAYEYPSGATPSNIPTPTSAVLPTPTLRPTAIPTRIPTATPTVHPTAVPTVIPTLVPTKVPTAIPTVLPTPTPVITKSIHVQYINLLLQKQFFRRAYATAYVKVVDQSNKPIPSAYVSGIWSQLVPNISSATTNSSGIAVFKSKSTFTHGTFVFSIRYLKASGYVYDPSQNLVNSASATW